MKDHEIREFINRLTAIAKKYGHTQQLREHIHKEVLQTIYSDASKKVNKDDE